MAKLSAKGNGREILRFERFEPARPEEERRAYRDFRVYFEGGKVLGRTTYYHANGKVDYSTGWTVIGHWTKKPGAIFDIRARRHVQGWTCVSILSMDDDERASVETGRR